MEKQEILIVEDSPAVGILLKNYLNNLGWETIHNCNSGQSALTVFDDLASQGKQFIVFLDFMLPDMDARSILTQMLEKKPDVKVILETASEKDDEGIKELIRLGVYQFLEKPIRFESLKNIKETIEKEESFFINESSSEKSLREDTEEFKENLHEHINFVLKSINQISLNKITGIMGFENDTITSYLKKLVEEKKIVEVGDVKEISCNRCDSVRTSPIFYCPNCKGSNFKLGKLIEHYDCGNITEENTYVDDQCPNCNKEIKALGVDYRVMKNHYICNSCNEFFPEISIEYMCLKCENRFDLDKARWRTSPNYKIINM